jgi:glycosyltransferase involved in cell wall biosynthesis
VNKRKAKVVFLFSGLQGGGAQRVMLTLSRHLDRSRFAPELIIGLAGWELDGHWPDDIPVHSLGYKRFRQALPGIIARLWRIRPDVIICSTGHANLALLALRYILPGSPKIVIREPNTPSKSLAGSSAPGLFRWAYRVFYKRADAIICQSDWIANELRNDFAVAAERLHRLRNPVDIDAMRRAAGTVQRHPGDGVRFIAAGRLTHQKGFDRLLDHFAALPAQAHLTLVGNGPDEQKLRQSAEHLGIADRVQLLGFVQEPWPYYAGADAFLLPSRWEGMPNAALEALACGTPVIGTPESGGLGEVADLNAGKGVTLAAPGTAFVDAMLAVKADPPKALRPSLLPLSFESGQAVAGFEDLLDTVARK